MKDRERSVCQKKNDSTKLGQLKKECDSTILGQMKYILYGFGPFCVLVLFVFNFVYSALVCFDKAKKEIQGQDFTILGYTHSMHHLMDHFSIFGYPRFKEPFTFLHFWYANHPL